MIADPSVAVAEIKLRASAMQDSVGIQSVTQTLRALADDPGLATDDFRVRQSALVTPAGNAAVAKMLDSMAGNHALSQAEFMERNAAAASSQGRQVLASLHQVTRSDEGLLMSDLKLLGTAVQTPAGRQEALSYINSMGREHNAPLSGNQSPVAGVMAHGGTEIPGGSRISQDFAAEMKSLEHKVFTSAGVSPEGRQVFHEYISRIMGREKEQDERVPSMLKDNFFPVGSGSDAQSDFSGGRHEGEGRQGTGSRGP